MDKEREPQTLTYRYKQHPLVSKAALYAEMNFPCRKYMEDGNLVIFYNFSVFQIKK